MRDEGIYIGRGGASLTILPPDLVDLENNSLRFPIEIRADHLTADVTMDLEGWGGWVPSFIGYFDDLAAERRGWQGAKEWADDSGAVRLSAAHNQITEVQLTVSLRPFFGNDDPGTWELEVAIPCESDRMSVIAGAARLMIARAGVSLVEASRQDEPSGDIPAR